MQRQQARARMSNVVSVLLASRLWLDGYRLNEVMAIDKPFCLVRGYSPMVVHGRNNIMFFSHLCMMHHLLLYLSG